MKSFLNEHTNNRNTQKWMADLLSRIELVVSMNHTVTNQDGTEEERTNDDTQLVGTACAGS